MPPLVEVVDILFPSLYTFYYDQSGWKLYATANVNEAKRIAGGKPVIPYLWPQFHDSNSALKGTHLLGSYWRLELEHLKSLACPAAVLWGGWQTNWNESACWWAETKDFVNKGG